ncbi:MAG: hypothetical protein SFZ24_05605 [Planctomycetota bacterium]|nr:hypothetical protein [Planctomycetota bacterium]
MAIRTVSACSLLVMLAGATFAQDSVSRTPGNSDALTTTDDPIITRYIVDAVSLTSSWGGQFQIAPVLKAHRDADPMFPTQLLGSAAVSPDQQQNLSFPAILYSLWTTPGQGISILENNTPSNTIPVASFTRQFGVGFSDLSTGATNAAGALIGQNASAPSRFFVTRVLAASSGYTSADPVTSTVSLGAIDSRGNLFLRADNFNGSGNQVQGENIVRVGLPARNAGINTLFFSGVANSSDQPGATSYLVNNSSVTTNTPAAIPQTATPAIALVLDFANNYRANGAAGVTSHLAGGIAAHRGNPSYANINPFGGVGTVASLARPSSGNRTNALNLFAVTSTGAVASARGATLPANITDGAGFTANTASNAEFLQYLSQTTFRGGNGQVAVGSDPLTSTTIAAAVATDPTAGEFVAVARFGVSTSWTVAAFEGKQVLNGPSGTAIGTIANGNPVTFSAPGADRQGNLYFVAAFQPTVGPQTTALIKAVNTAAGYRLERILQAGQTFAGANSGREYTIEKLTLADSDSVASGTFFSGNVLQPTFPNENPTGPADPRSVGGLIVNAQIVYNNAGTPEPYQAVLLVTPQIQAPPPFCTGDANNDGQINFADITSVLANFNNIYTPGSGGAGDANNDGAVNFADVTAVLQGFGTACP